VRQLVRDFPYFARAVKVIVDYSVGPGILFQARFRGADSKLNRALNQQIEDAFNWWADEADFCGKLHFYEMMQLEKRQDLECGELLVVKTVSRDKGRLVPFALRVYEPDWLDTSYSTQEGNRRIERGVEYDYPTGKILAYHFTDPDAWGKPIRIPKENIIHGFETLRPGQRRGISPFVPGVLLAGDLQTTMESEMDASKMASKWLAIVETDSATAFQAGRGATVDATGKKIESLENAVIEYLRPGEKINFQANPRPGGNFAPFVKLVLTMLSITTGVPYELLSGDYLGLNYSVSRAKRLDFSKELRPIAIRHVRHFCQPAALGFMESAVLAGKLNLPKFFSEPYSVKIEWQPPGMESIDPAREVKSQIDEIMFGLRSPQEVVGSRGRDLETVLKEIVEAKEMAEELGLEFNKPSTALANNPDALDKQDGGEEDEEK
jgi:lambda family phage portal protein